MGDGIFFSFEARIIGALFSPASILGRSRSVCTFPPGDEAGETDERRDDDESVGAAVAVAERTDADAPTDAHGECAGTVVGFVGGQLSPLKSL